MEKYSWIKVKQKNTEQGEPGSYERLYMRTVWAILYSENVSTVISLLRQDRMFHAEGARL